MVICPICEHENRSGVIVCEKCHNDLYVSLLEQVSTKQLDESRERAIQVGQSSPPSSNPIVVYIRNAPEPLIITRSGAVTVGRTDPKGGHEQPDLALDAFDAADMGVSREHIRIDAAVDVPTITDLGSYNGTYVNGQQLTPHKTYPLQSSDEVRLGRMILRFFYR